MNKNEEIKFFEDLQEKLIIEEYKSCRNLILKNIEIMERAEIFIFGGAAAAAAFVVNEYVSVSKLGYPSDVMVVLSFISLLPFLISLIGVLVFIVIDKSVGIYNNYIERLENRILDNVAENRKYMMRFTVFFREQNRNPKISSLHYFLWTIMIVVSAAFSMAMIYIIQTKFWALVLAVVATSLLVSVLMLCSWSCR